MTDKGSRKKKLSKFQVEDLVWSMWEAYENDYTDNDDLPLPEWGSSFYVHGDEETGPKNEDEVRRVILTKIDVIPEVVTSVMGSIGQWRECVVYDDRELSGEVRDWTTELHRAQGKRPDPSKLERLRTMTEEFIDGLTPDMYQYGSLKDEVLKWFTEKTGVPRDGALGLTHWGKISREEDEKHQESRKEVYERLLREFHIFVK